MGTRTRVGVIGAGQLAQMMVEPALRLDIDLYLFAASSTDSAALIAPHVVGDFLDKEAVLAFARECDVVTFEHELIPLDIIQAMEAEGVTVYPSSRAFQYSQDKAMMRAKLTHFPAPSSTVISKASEITAFPVIAKAIRGGYDGRGVFKVESQSELEDILLHTSPLLIEELITFDAEIAVMVARTPDGATTSWVPVETVQRDGICIYTVTPAQVISSDLAIEARRIAEAIATLTEVVGVMAVEMFVKGETLYINELAMRPHNSGHWSIEGSKTSQFEQHLRAILNMELGETALVAPLIVMGNILGGSRHQPFSNISDLISRLPELHFHDYKKESRPGRKIGHVTMMGENLLQLTHDVQYARDYMSGVNDGK
jgi:5-(carboxyamino)imidazole ribonucleotide synthase